MIALRAAVRGGEGTVARVGAGVLLLLPGGTGAAGEALLAILTEACGSGQAAPGRVLARRLAGYLAAEEPGSIPPFGAVAPADNGVAVLLHGAVEVFVQRADGHERLSGNSAATWVDRIVMAPFDSLLLGAEGLQPWQPEPRLALDSGIVPGGGVALFPDGAAPASGAAQPFDLSALPQTPAGPQPSAAQEPPPEDYQPAQEQPDATLLNPALPPSPEAVATAAPAFTSFALNGDEAEQREPLPVAGEQQAEARSEAPLVEGILCELGHFNHPEALWCSHCGRSTVHRTRALVKRQRPTLGVLVLDDGSTFNLDADYVVGREPEQADPVRNGQARPLLLTDPARSTSRVHAEIVLEGWSVNVVDRGSANGTFVLPPGASSWERLSQDRPRTLLTGARVAFGQRVALFDTHHQTA